MNKNKSTKDLWYKAQTIGIATGVILKTIELATPHTEMLGITIAGIEHCYTWTLLLSIIATEIPI